MIIITADDFGKDKHTTDCIVECYQKGRITSASAMVFMKDSERAAAMALQSNMEVGLHLNFTMPFNCNNLQLNIREHHNKIISYLKRNKLFQVIYNPNLSNSFRYLFLSQQEESMRLYGKPPVFFNGHHHMHLCANALLGKIIPKGSLVRRTFTFSPGEKNLFNRLYRYSLDIFVSRYYISTDSLFSLSPVNDYRRLQSIFSRAFGADVEIEAHPESLEEKEFLLSDQFQFLLDSVQIGSFHEIYPRI